MPRMSGALTDTRVVLTCFSFFHSKPDCEPFRYKAKRSSLLLVFAEIIASGLRQAKRTARGVGGQNERRKGWCPPSHIFLSRGEFLIPKAAWVGVLPLTVTQWMATGVRTEAGASGKHLQRRKLIFEFLNLLSFVKLQLQHILIYIWMCCF